VGVTRVDFLSTPKTSGGKKLTASAGRRIKRALAWVAANAHELGYLLAFIDRKNVPPPATTWTQVPTLR